MNELAPEAPPVARKKKWLLYTGIGLLALLAAASGVLYLLYNAAARELQAAMAEADRLDPGWRAEDLEAARADVPPDENAALQVLGIRAQMPKAWLPEPPNGKPGLEQIILALPAPVRLDEEQIAQLRAELDKAADAVDAARKLAGMPRGRHRIQWSPDYVGTPLPHIQELYEVARLLQSDAIRRVHDGDLEGALVSCRAVLNLGRSLGDEPCAISQMTRAAHASRALRTLERILAQGEAPAPALEVIQLALEREADEPLQLIAARAERAGIHRFMQVVRAGKLDRVNYGMRAGPLGHKGDDILDGVKARRSHAPMLRYLTQMVEVAKLPPERQHPRLGELEHPQVDLPDLLVGLTRGGEPAKIARLFHRVLGETRCAAAALAAERYRLENGRWPEDLEALVPRYLGAVPTDPFDGQPLRFRKLGDGIVIYSVGLNRIDDGGTLDKRDAENKDTADIGFRLWNAEHRKQPPPKKD